MAQASGAPGFVSTTIVLPAAYDIAPRFKFEYDIFGNNALRVGAGANRYYGRHLSAYAFHRYRPIITQRYDISDGSEVPHGPTVGVSKSYNSSGLSTPYSDEISGELSGFYSV